MARSLAGPAVSFMAVPLGFAMRNQGVLMVIGHTLGQVMVVTFSTTRTLTNMAFQVMSMVCHLAVWPEISAAFGAKDLETARKLHRKACHVAFWMSSAAVVGLLCCGRWGFAIWTGGKVPFNFYLFATLLLVIVVNSLWYASSAVPMATNTHQRTASFFLLGTCIAVLLAWFLTRSIGVVGGAISLLAIDALMLVTVVPQSLRLVGDTAGAGARPQVVLSLPRLDMFSACHVPGLRQARDLRRRRVVASESHLPSSGGSGPMNWHSRWSRRGQLGRTSDEPARFRVAKVWRAAGEDFIIYGSVGGQLRAARGTACRGRCGRCGIRRPFSARSMTVSPLEIAARRGRHLRRLVRLVAGDHAPGEAAWHDLCARTRQLAHALSTGSARGAISRGGPHV